MIKLDFTQNSTVATCTQCSSWCQIRSSKAAAWAAGAEHQSNVHPGIDQAANALQSSQRKARREAQGLPARWTASQSAGGLPGD